MNSYLLAQFVGEYLRKYRSKLACNEIDTQAELEQSILYRSTIRLDGTVERQERICSRTSKKWLNCLGYKWKDVQKCFFFEGHEREDVVKYWELFLEERKSLLRYFVKFEKNDKILPKEYPSDCAVGGPDQRPIIMITHDESTFFANDTQQKIWMLKGYNTGGACSKSAQSPEYLYPTKN